MDERNQSVTAPVAGKCPTFTQISVSLSA
jgi:hypothetical protein